MFDGPRMLRFLSRLCFEPLRMARAELFLRDFSFSGSYTVRRFTDLLAMFAISMNNVQVPFALRILTYQHLRLHIFDNVGFCTLEAHNT
jgi:hypothetical protein